MEKIYEEKIPVTVFGVDSKGETFAEDGYTTSLARGWVTLPLRHRLRPGAEIIIFNKANGNQAEFLLEKQEGGALKAVLKDVSVDIWERDFGQVAEPVPDLRVRVHIVCERCGTHESVALEDEEVDHILEGQTLRRRCSQCVAETDWISATAAAERAAAAAAAAPPPASRPEPSPKPPARPAPPAPVAILRPEDRRTSRRIQMKTTARIRRATSGGTEIVAPLNVSRGGIAYESRLSYEMEELIFVAMHYREGGELMETPGRIVRVSPGARSFGYGVKFEA